MKKNHFLRIFVTYILIVLTGSILIGLLSIQLFKVYFLNSAQETMSSNINLIEDNLIDMHLKGETVDYNYLAKKYSSNIKATVSFVDEKGNIIGESIRGFNKNRNIIKNEEILSAKKNRFGNTFYYDYKLNVHILNIAKYVNNDNFNGYIYLTTSLEEIKNINQGIIFYSLIGVVFVLTASFILKIFFEKDIVLPLQGVVENSREINDTNLKGRIEIISDDILGTMAIEYNSMLDRIEEHITKLQLQNNEMEYSLNSMDIGIIIIDTENRIVFTNPTAIKIYNSEDDEQLIKGKKAVELIKDAKLYSIIKECIESGDSNHIESEVEQDKIVKVFVNPIKSKTKNDNVIGCLAIIYDITHVKKLEQMSSDFVSNVSHEIKTPLTSIKGFVETLKEGALEDSDVAYKFLDIIDLECDRLYSLINDILELSEIQNIEQDVNRNFYYIQDIVKEVVMILNTQAQNKEMELTADVSENIPLVLINKNRIKQMIINIVGNAIKYTNIGGYVKVSAYQEDDKVVISVKDNGIGIPEDSLKRLFERFYRVDKGRSRRMGGTGLGLSIVKQIIDLYNGEIDIKSEVGKGTEFIVKLPIKVG